MADLWLHDDGSEFPADAEALMAKSFVGITDSRLIVPISDWNDLAKEIQKHTTIDHLGFHFHAFSGGMLVGGDGRELNEKSVTDLFKNSKTRIAKISFWGCHTGNAPTNMLDFAKIFSAKEVGGYTWTMVWQWVVWNFPRGSTQKAIRDTMAGYDKLSIEMLPAPQVMESQVKSGDRTLKTIAMYGSRDDTILKDLPIKVHDREHKGIKDAEVRNIKPADAVQVERELLTSPVPPFQRVVVNI